MVYNNYNINGVYYNGYTITKIYGCGGVVVWFSEQPQPTTQYRWVRTDDTTCINYTPSTYRWMRTNDTTCVEDNG